MLKSKGKLFESLGCLVLVPRDCIGSSDFTIYEMSKGCSMWSIKYIVNTNDFMNSLPEGWLSRSIVCSIVLGEREDDSFLMINLSTKVVQYNLILKTLSEIYDMRSNEIADDYLHGFIPPYAMYDSDIKNLTIRSSFDCDFVSLDPIINSKKYIIENSFTLASTEEAEKLRYSNLAMVCFEPNYANDDSNFYGCARLRCLLLVRRDDFCSSEFTIYEMMKGIFVWSDRYHVDIDNFMTSLLEGWSIRSTVWSIVLGEREDDSFLVINLSGKVVEFNLISKNLREMYDVGSNQVVNDYHDGFIPPFAMYGMRAKQVDHKLINVFGDCSEPLPDNMMKLNVMGMKASVGRPRWTPKDVSVSTTRTEKNKSLVSATPLSTAFFSFFIVQDFQDSPDDEEDTRSSQEYLNDLVEEYQARALLAKSKRFFKKGTQRFISTKDEEEVSSYDNEIVEVKLLMALAEENNVVGKESSRNGERTDNGTELKNNTLINFCDEKWNSQNFSFPYTPEQNGIAERKNRTLIEAARTMLSGSAFSKQYWTEVVATACYTQNKSTIVKRHLKTPYELFRKRIPNINFLHVFGCPVYIHNHKYHLGKFNEKADDGYLLRYSLVSKAFRVFNTRRQQTEETYHITFGESNEAIKLSKPSVDNINIAKSERYPPDKYLHPYEPSQRYQTNSYDVSFIEPYECPEPVVLETKVSSDQNGQIDQNDQSVQNDEILNGDHSKHSNHTNDEKIINNLLKTKDIHISEHLSSPNVEDTST
nr:retrovirus-related Pol polyprotein from transposon TNT 1-94 [Tanacetum cinerariifolium]